MIGPIPGTWDLGPGTWDLGQLAAEVIAAVPCLDLHFEFFDLAVQFLEVIKKPLHKNPKLTRQLIDSIFDQLWNARGDVANTLGNGQTKLTEKPTDLVGLRRARPHKSLPYPVQGEYRLPLDILIGTKRIVGRPTASQMASASAASFLLVLT